jgi:hypothetical protein
MKSKTKVKPQKHLSYEISNSQHVPDEAFIHSKSRSITLSIKGKSFIIQMHVSIGL